MPSRLEELFAVEIVSLQERQVLVLADAAVYLSQSKVAPTRTDFHLILANETLNTQLVVQRVKICILLVVLILSDNLAFKRVSDCEYSEQIDLLVFYLVFSWKRLCFAPLLAYMLVISKSLEIVPLVTSRSHVEACLEQIHIKLFVLLIIPVLDINVTHQRIGHVPLLLKLRLRGRTVFEVH